MGNFLSRVVSVCKVLGVSFVLVCVMTMRGSGPLLRFVSMLEVFGSLVSCVRFLLGACIAMLLMLGSVLMWVCVVVIVLVLSFGMRQVPRLCVVLSFVLRFLRP